MTMNRGTCDRDGCENSYTVTGGEESLFVSFAVSPHDVDGIEKRAVSLCEECAEDVDAVLERDADLESARRRLSMLEDVVTSSHDDAIANQSVEGLIDSIREDLGGEPR